MHGDRDDHHPFGRIALGTCTRKAVLVRGAASVRLVVAPGELTVAQWDPPLAVPKADPAKLRAMWWGVRAIGEARSRYHSCRDDAFASWIAAVEGVWWAMSLDDELDAVLGTTVYRGARDADEYGRTVAGMRWVRNRLLHEIVIAGAGGPKRPFFVPPGERGVFSLSPANRWLPSSDVLAQRDLSPGRSPGDSVVSLC